MTHEQLSQLIRDQKERLAALESRYAAICQALAFDFGRTDGPSWESSGTLTEWATVRARAREVKGFIVQLEAF